jgi:lipopolysaccharide/colanic/teichoic acid biosynthesis glycosyltransferase
MQNNACNTSEDQSGFGNEYAAAADGQAAEEYAWRPKPLFDVVKRCFDVVASLAALILLSPVFLVLAVCIKGEDGGPVFYRQSRLKMGGGTFRIIKF